MSLIKNSHSTVSGPWCTKCTVSCDGKKELKQYLSVHHLFILPSDRDQVHDRSDTFCLRHNTSFGSKSLLLLWRIKNEWENVEFVVQKNRLMPNFFVDLGCVPSIFRCHLISETPALSEKKNFVRINAKRWRPRDSVTTCSSKQLFNTHQRVKILNHVNSVSGQS